VVVGSVYWYRKPHDISSKYHYQQPLIFFKKLKILTTAFINFNFNLILIL